MHTMILPRQANQPAPTALACWLVPSAAHTLRLQPATIGGRAYRGSVGELEGLVFTDRTPSIAILSEGKL
jgi:hypothetical protein